MRRSAETAGIWGGLALGSASWVVLACIGQVWRQPMAFVAAYLTAFAGYALILAALRRGDYPLPTRALGGLLLCGALWRLLVLGGGPSDDVNRYIWEGRVQRAGHNPYLLAPDAPQLAPLRARAPEAAGINHPTWTAIYPPVAMLWHRLLGRSVLMLKLSFLAAEALLLALVGQLLAQRGLHAGRLLIYYLNPLPIWAFAQEGHHDAIGLLTTCAALALLLKRPRGLASGAVFALAVLSKGFALVLALQFLLRHGPRPLIGALLTVLLCYLPFADAGPALSRSLLRFGGELHYNDSLHAVFFHGARALGLPRPEIISRGIALALCVAAGLWILRRWGDDELKCAAGTLAAFFLLAPTVHPWYFALLLPLLCFFPWPGWLALSATCVLPNLAQLQIARTGEWVEWQHLKWPEYGPLFIWLGWRALRPRLQGATSC